MSRPNRRTFLRHAALAGAGAVLAPALEPLWRAARAASPPELISRNEWPAHWESTLAALGRDAITANDRFFVRSHFGEPEIDPRAFRLEVEGMVDAPRSFTLQELRAMPAEVREITLECAGNGRGLYRLANTAGTQWEYGAVGNARWSGPLLREVLKAAGARSSARHVVFEAADAAAIPGPPSFSRSLPIEKALDDVVLALEMNGAPLPRSHGAPLRAVVPGWYGMASTKWLVKLRLQSEPSDNHFMARSYRYVYPGGDPTSTPPVEAIAVKSLITSPLEGEQVARGRAIARGFAWSGPVRVARVEVSVNGGSSWSDATLEGDSISGAWRPWSLRLASLEPGAYSVMARATDARGTVQPLQAKPNASGYANNSIHRVAFHVRG